MSTPLGVGNTSKLELFLNVLSVLPETVLCGSWQLMGGLRKAGFSPEADGEARGTPGPKTTATRSRTLGSGCPLLQISRFQTCLHAP